MNDMSWILSLCIQHPATSRVGYKKQDSDKFTGAFLALAAWKKNFACGGVRVGVYV